MTRFTRHVTLPAFAPVSIVALYFTPVMWFGCVNRGLIGLTIVLASAAGAFLAIGRGFRARARGESSDQWIVTALILTLPLALILGPLG